MDAIFDERDITIEICLKKLEIVLKKTPLVFGDGNTVPY